MIHEIDLAIKSDNLAELKKYTAYLNQHDYTITPLTRAVHHQAYQCMEYICQHSDVNLQSEDYGTTALYHACSTCDFRALQILLGFGASPLIPSFDGITPVIKLMAVKELDDYNSLQYQMCVQLLYKFVNLSSNVDINDPNTWVDSKKCELFFQESLEDKLSKQGIYRSRI